MSHQLIKKGKFQGSFPFFVLSCRDVHSLQEAITSGGGHSHDWLTGEPCQFLSPGVAAVSQDILRIVFIKGIDQYQQFAFQNDYPGFPRLHVALEPVKIDPEGLVHTNRNAEADQSMVIYAYKKRMAKNPTMELKATVMLHRMDNEPWTEEELSPIKYLEIVDITPTDSALGANITFFNGEKYEIDFKDIDGKRTC